MLDDLGHYDTVASAFLSTGATMIAIIAGLAPLAKSQNVLNERTLALYAIAAVLLGSVVVLSIFGLVTKGSIEKKRTLCVIPSIPLAIGVLILLSIMF